MSRKTIETYKKEVYNLVGDEYSVLGEEYKTNKDKILHRHNKCGNEYLVRPNDFLYGKRCPKCCYKKSSDKLRKTIETYKKEVYNLVGDEYSVLGEEYINNKTKILHRHNKCGNEYLVRPNDFLTGYRCPNCSIEQTESSGIKLIKKILKDNNINFISEKEFKGCKFKENLRFDIYIKSKNLLIEFDGQQHFIVRGNTKFESSMSDRIKRDWIKNLWCFEHDIKLLRIPYTMSNQTIQEIIKKIVLTEELDLEFLDKKNLYLDNSSNFIYNKINYYSQRNYLYFSLYSKEIEEATRFYFK